MRIVRHLISGGLAVAGLALGSPAAALVFNTTTTTTFNWSLGGNDTNNPAGLPMGPFNASAKVGTDKTDTKITVTATAFNATKTTGATNYTFTAASVEQYSGGLGVMSGTTHDNPGTCGNGGCNAHQIDNMGNAAESSSIDFIRLDFSKPVVLGGFGQTVYPMLYADESKKNGSYKTQYDDDYSVGVLVGDPSTPGKINKTDVVAGLAGVSNLATIFGIADPNSTSCTGSNGNPCTDTATVYTKYQSGAATASTTWYVAASILSDYRDGNPDGFKLASLTAYYKTYTSHTSMAPEPSSWMTMIVGFGVAGTAIRRSRRQKAAAAA